MPVFAKWIKKLTSIFVEKTQVKQDDFELEHFLLYHGLVGTSPENQRQFKDVRADLKDAIQSGSSRQVASMLKLPPLWWEEKLKSIFSEFTDRALLLAVLAPDVNEESLTHDHVPLLHEDWQVRANAALLLAHLGANEVIEKIERCLNDTASSAPIAFCHVATALGRLGHQRGEEALLTYVSHEDPWIRVDVVSALSLFGNGQPTKHVISGLLDKHSLSDYTAVAVSRSIKQETFFQNADPLSIAAGCQLVSELISASTGTFSEDIVTDSGADECFPALVKLLEETPSCTIVAAAIRLAEWRQLNQGDSSLPAKPGMDKALTYLHSEACSKLIKDQLNLLSTEAALDDPLKLCELRNAIELAGRLGDSANEGAIKKALSQNHRLLDDAITCLSRLKAKDSATELIQLAGNIEDLENRWLQPKQLNPVQEPNRAHAKTYWLILKALATMPSSETAQFLLKATQDHAPDKRSQALESLNSVVDDLDEGDRKGIMPEFQNRLSEALSDPAADVRKTALRGVATFAVVADLKKVVGLTRAREVSTQREAFDTLSELAKKGHKKDVVETVAQALKTEPDVHKRQKLRDFIDDNSPEVPANRLEP